MTASRTIPPLYDRLCDAIGQCDEIEKAFAAADKLCTDLYGRLPAAAEAFYDADPDGIDITFQVRFLARLKAFLVGQLTREEWTGGAKAASPYISDYLVSGKPFIRDHDKPLHDAWTEGFKTDDERQDDEAERRSDEEQGR